MAKQIKANQKGLTTAFDKKTFVIQRMKKDSGYAVIGLNQSECRELMAELKQFAGQSK